MDGCHPTILNKKNENEWYGMVVQCFRAQLPEVPAAWMIAG